MAIRLQQFLPTPNGVQANGTGSLNLPLGATYYKLAMDVYDGTNVVDATKLDALISNIRLKINGTQVRQYDKPSTLVAINKMHGIDTKFGTASGDKHARIVMYFAEPQRRTPIGEDVLAWQMYTAAGVGSFTLEFDVSSAASAAFNVQVSREYAILPNVTQFSNIVWHSSQTLPNDTAGKPTTSTLQKTAYYRIHAFAAADTFAGAQVKVNDLIIREFRTYEEYVSYNFDNALNVVDNWMSIIFDPTNRYQDVLDLRNANSFELQYTTAKAGAITLVLEEVKGLGR